MSCQSVQFNDLPDELVLNVLGYLSEKELSQVNTVSQRCHRLAIDHTLYQAVCETKFPSTCKKRWVSQYAHDKGWKCVFELLMGKKLSSHAYHASCLDGPICAAVEGPVFIIADLSGICSWDLDSGSKLSSVEFQNNNRCLPIALALEENFLAMTDGLNHLEIRDAATLAITHILQGHSAEITSVDMHNNLAVSGSADCTVILWDIIKGHCLRTYSGHPDQVNAVAIDGEYIISGDVDGLIKIWSTCSDDCLGDLFGHYGAVNCLDIEGHYVVSGGEDWKVRVWNCEKKECLYIFEDHQGSIAQVMIQNQRILSVDWSQDCEEEGKSRNQKEEDGKKNVMLWDMTTHACIKKFSTLPVKSVALQGEVVLSNSNFFLAQRFASSSGYNKAWYSVYTVGSYAEFNDRSFTLQTIQRIGQAVKQMTLTIESFFK